MLADRYEAEAEEAILAQTTHKAELAKIEAILANIDSVQTKFKNKTEQLTTEEIFVSNEVSREIVGFFIDKVVIDDKNDRIKIKF